MGDWNVFFATTAGSAATLVGLLFVATQLHLGALADPKNRWAALAQSTLTILSIAFALSASFLIPMLSPQVRGEIILLVVVVPLWRSVRIWWPRRPADRLRSRRCDAQPLRHCAAKCLAAGRQCRAGGRFIVSKDSPNPNRQDGNRQA